MEQLNNFVAGKRKNLKHFEVTNPSPRFTWRHVDLMCSQELFLEIHLTSEWQQSDCDTDDRILRTDGSLRWHIDSVCFHPVAEVT